MEKNDKKECFEKKSKKKFENFKKKIFFLNFFFQNFFFKVGAKKMYWPRWEGFCRHFLGLGQDSERSNSIFFSGQISGQLACFVLKL